MSDTTINAFLGEGTNAEMLAFTPSPPSPVSGPDPLYLFRNTTDGKLYYWDGANWQFFSAGLGTVTNTGTLTDHCVIVGNGGVDVSAIGTGTAGQVLTSNGSGSDPSFQSATSGSLVLLEQYTASASASLNFTSAISSSYDTYLIEFVNIIPATDAAVFCMRMSTNGGSSYDSGANYSWTHWRWLAGGSGTAGLNAQAEIQVMMAIDTTASANWSLNGSLTFYNPGGAKYKQVVGEFSDFDNAANAFLGASVRGAYLSTTAVNAFQFLMNTGNITSGTVRCYGLAK